MPAQPSRDRLGGGIYEKDALPRDEHVIEPHLAVKLVVAAAERCNKRVGVAHRDLAAERRDSRCTHRHDETRTMPANLDAAHRADIDILGIGRARMHAELAADDHPSILFAYELQCDAVARVLAHALPDDRCAAAIGEEPPGTRDQLAIRDRFGDVFLRGAQGLRRGQHAHRDQIAVGRRVRDVAGTQKCRSRKGSAHADQIIGAPRQHISPRIAGSMGIRRR